MDIYYCYTTHQQVSCSCFIFSAACSYKQLFYPDVGIGGIYANAKTNEWQSQE